MQNRMEIMVICGLYLLSLLIVGFWAMRRNKKASDYLVAGRKLNLLLTSCTIAAVQIGAGVVLGGASNGAAMGVWPGMYYALGCGGGCILAGIFVAKKMRSANGIVPLDYFEARFGHNKWVRIWTWFSNVPSMLGIFVAQLLACGSILAAFDVPFEWGVTICALVILIYSSIGGMWAVVVGDVIQTGIKMIGLPIIAIACLMALSDKGVPAISTIYATPFIPEGLFTKFIYLVSPFLIAISVSYDAFIRYNSAKDGETAKWGCIWGGVLTIFLGILASTVGAVGHIMYPEVKTGVFAYMVANTVNPYLAGIVIAAVLAACMSAGNGLLLSMGASFSRDFYNKVLHPNAEFDDLPYSKTISMATVIIATLVGILVSFHLTDILDAIILFNYPYMGSMLIPLLAGILYPGATPKGCFAAMGVGAFIGVFCFLAAVPSPITGIVNPDMGLFAAYLASFVVLVAVSKWDKAHRQSLEVKSVEVR